MAYNVQLPQYLSIFELNGYDSWITIKNLTDKELLDIGIIKQGHRKKILLHMKMLK